MRVQPIVFLIIQISANISTFAGLERFFNHITAFDEIVDLLQPNIQNVNENLTTILLKVEDRIQQEVTIFKEAARTITKAAEKSLDVNQTYTSWPVCCTLDQFFNTGVDQKTTNHNIYQNKINVSHYNSTYKEWTDRSLRECTYFSSANIKVGHQL